MQIMVLVQNDLRTAINKKDYKSVALGIMYLLQKDAGKPIMTITYPTDVFEKITEVLVELDKTNPELFNYDFINDIIDIEEFHNNELCNKYPTYRKLDSIIEDYFETI